MSLSDTIALMILRERQIAYAVTDRDLRIVEVNDPSGALPELCVACLGCPLTDIVPELVGYEETLDQIVAGILTRFEVSWINRELPDGREVYLTMLFLPYRGQDNTIVGLLHIVQDVTEAGCLEQAVTQQRNELLLVRDQLLQQNAQLIAVNAELQQFDAVKSSFVSIAAHELRTPLTAIIGYLELLSGGDAGSLNDLQADYLEAAETATRRLLRVTNDLLDVTRLETGRLELVLRPTDLGAVVAEVAAAQRMQLQARSQTLNLYVPDHLPLALCDAVRAGQIISNLVSNAAKFSPPAAVIDVCVSEAAEPGYLQVSVADHGVGIPPEKQADLFRPFGRAGATRATETAGIGLGLFIARSLVDLHGGRIWFRSLPNEGATFYVNFPTADHLPTA